MDHDSLDFHFRPCGNQPGRNFLGAGCRVCLDQCRATRRLDVCFSVGHGAHHRHWIYVSVSRISTVLRGWRHFPASSGPGSLRSIPASLGGWLAANLRDQRHDRSISQCVCLGGATFPPRARVESAGSNANRTGLQDHPASCAAGVRGSNCARYDQVPPRAASHCVISWLPYWEVSTEQCAAFAKSSSTGLQETKGDSMATLTKKVALVTGGSRGIGAAIAKRLAADGASVAITYSKDADAASSVVKAIEGAGGKAIAIQADAADAEAVKGAVKKTVTTLGGIDVLVNNAGTAIPKSFEDTTLEELHRLFNINVRGVMVATQAALKHMKSGGRIIMIGSCVGERMMTPGLVPYSATKGAVKMFTQGLSREVGKRGITVNNIQPGPIDTDLNPAAGDWAAPQKANTALDRYGHVDEVAALVAFVAGPESSYITGANLTVDGGTNAYPKKTELSDAHHCCNPVRHGVNLCV